MLEVTRQQTTQAESQLQELHLRSSQIQVPACLSYPTTWCCVLQAATSWSLGPWVVSRCELP